MDTEIANSSASPNAINKKGKELKHGGMLTCSGGICDKWMGHLNKEGQLPTYIARHQRETGLTGRQKASGLCNKKAVTYNKRVAAHPFVKNIRWEEWLKAPWWRDG